MALTPRLVVEVFEHVNYQGRKVTVIDSVVNTEEVGLQDIISSIKIYKGPGFRAAPNYKAIFHEHANHQGRRLILAPGYYPSIHEIPYNFGDLISSISFTPAANPTPPEYGAIPLVVQVYRDIDFRGTRGVIMRDVSDFREIGLDNSVSSMQIQRGPNFPSGGCRAIFYQQPNFEGQRLTVPLGPRDFQVRLRNLHDARSLRNSAQPFLNVVSSVKVVPVGSFQVLVVVADNRTNEPAVLESLVDIEGHEVEYTIVNINSNPDNYGDPNNASKLSSVILSEYDIVWFTWNGPAHDREYFVEDSDQAIREFVRRGGVVWASAMDDNIVAPDGVHTHESSWRGDWLPVDQHPIRVVNSGDVKANITREGHQTGIFAWPHKIDVNALVLDDHWVTEEPEYVRLAIHDDDNNAPIGFQLRYGDGYYVTFAIDTRDAMKTAMAKTLIENALCYLANLAWQTSPRQPLKGRSRSIPSSRAWRSVMR